MTLRTTVPAALTAAAFAALLSGAALAEVKGSLPSDKVSDLEERIEQLEKQLGKTKIKSQSLSLDDGTFSAKIRGRIHYDLAWYDSDNVDLVGFGHEMRRARLGFEGTMETDWKYKIEVDLADNAVSTKDIFVEYAGLPVDITVGQFKVPFSIEELTSSRYDPTIESPAPVELFAPKRHRGLMGSYDNDFMLAALGAFVGSVEDGADNTGNATQDDDVWVAGRLGGFFQPEKNKVAYVGGAVAWQNSNDGAAARFRVRPARSHVTSTRLIDTGNLANIDDITRFNVETFLEYERVYVQAEYLRADVGRTAGLSDLDFNGWYVTVGAFVWGDGELYRPFKGGETSRPKVYNALELVASYDTADLTDGTLIGGEQDSWVVGATWWFNPYVKLMANYAKSDVERPGNIADNEEPGVFMMRIALEY